MKIELVELVTAGDKRTDVELTQLGGKSLFVKELQTALLENTADIAVHSVKDMSVTPCPGLILAAVCKREDARDALIAIAFRVGEIYLTPSLAQPALDANVNCVDTVLTSSSNLCAATWVRDCPNSITASLTPLYSPAPDLNGWDLPSASLNIWIQRNLSRQSARALSA